MLIFVADQFMQRAWTRSYDVRYIEAISYSELFCGGRSWHPRTVALDSTALSKVSRGPTCNYPVGIESMFSHVVPNGSSIWAVG
jgi:hypothetical protein